MVDQALSGKAIATPASGDTVVGVTAAGLVRRFTMTALAAVLVPLMAFAAGPGTPTPASAASIFGDFELNPVRYGADPSGVADSTAAWLTVQALSNRVRWPPGIFKIQNFVLDVSQTTSFQGAGRNMTLFNITTNTTHGMVIGKNSPGGDDILDIGNFHMKYVGSRATGTAPLYAGIYLQRKTDMRNLWVENFPNDGIFFAAWDAPLDMSSNGTITRCLFFNMMTNVWVHGCGRAGINLRYGCNQNGFINCDLEHNKYGFWQHLDGSGTIYGNWALGGQCSYNDYQGWFIDEGNDFSARSVYAEGNGNSYTNVVEGADFWIGDTCDRIFIDMGNMQPVRPGGFQTWRGPASGSGTTTCRIKLNGVPKYGTA
jgi:hypothetical protein